MTVCQVRVVIFGPNSFSRSFINSCVPCPGVSSITLQTAPDKLSKIRYFLSADSYGRGNLFFRAAGSVINVTWKRVLEVTWVLLKGSALIKELISPPVLATP